MEGASDNITISIVKNSNCVERKKLNQVRIFCDFYLDACAGSFHHFVVPLPPGGRLAALGESPQFGGHPHRKTPVYRTVPYAEAVVWLPLGLARERYTPAGAPPQIGI